MIKRAILIAPLAMLISCGQAPSPSDDVAVRSAFDGVWRWSSGSTAMYDLVIADGLLREITPVSPTARTLPYSQCRCAIDDVDGLQIIQLVSDPDDRGYSKRWVFSFVEGREHRRRGPDHVGRGVFFEEIITPHELPLPRTMVQRGSLRRVSG